MGGKSYLAWERVEGRTRDFLAWLNDRLRRIGELTAAGVYDLSFEVHYRLVTIHPWSDGNGRMGRLLMNLVQMEGGTYPSFVRSERRASYMRSLRDSQEGGSSALFLAFMAEETIEVLSQTISEYTCDIGRDVPWA